jgi:hypothetical protein
MHSTIRYHRRGDSDTAAGATVVDVSRRIYLAAVVEDNITVRIPEGRQE